MDPSCGTKKRFLGEKRGEVERKRIGGPFIIKNINKNWKWLN
jgi:hypothetical protein